MVKIIFTRHALEKLGQRSISREMVYSAIDAPEKLIMESDKFLAFYKVGKKYLKVIFVREDDRIVVITQYFTNSLP
ncbi:MAG: DUF4258 domain-containing protein [bacterium]|nr:DUF4258 domain-containing protein [bacterium]